MFVAVRNVPFVLFAERKETFSEMLMREKAPIGLTITMKETTKRSIIRWIHILFALPLIGYIYGPPAETIQYLPYFQFIYFPVVALSGFWMWKGPAIRRLFSRGSNQKSA